MAEEKKEFRWEYKEIGQGHYYTDKQKCIDDATEASLKRQDLTVKIELCRPESKERFLLATLLGPIEVEFVEHKPKMFQLECDGEKDGDPFEAESLQEAQAKALALNGNVVKEIR